ncbi:hypothetical protein FKW77_008591 [Venturia effusa]|uniref:DUF3237 domain-containing protein n=1 Tax=Venturia effusa TaxID=50376 RepID=A0A517LHS7_9PEZI|nr:hypothetical protein FKW77_008591 [Venturia effusa]
MAPKLEKCFTMRAYLGKHDTVTLNTPGDATTKVILPLEIGWVEGSGLKADLMPGGSDWNSVSGPTFTPTKKVTLHCSRRSDSQRVFLGLVQTAVLSWSPEAKTTQFGDHTWFSQPIMETSDPAFKWVESTMFVGEGRFVVEERRTAVEYEIYKVVK